MQSLVRGTILNNKHHPLLQEEQSLLCQTNLQKCGIRGTDEVDVQSIMDIDYSKVECLLEELRNTSMSYIDQAIN